MLVKTHESKKGVITLTLKMERPSDKKLLVGIQKAVKENEKAEAQKLKDTQLKAAAKKGIAKKKTPAKKKASLKVA